MILCARLGGKNDPISDLHREEISIPSNVMDGTSQVYIYPLDLEFGTKFHASHVQVFNFYYMWTECYPIRPGSLK